MLLPRRRSRALIVFLLLIFAGVIHLAARSYMLAAEVLNPEMSGLSLVTRLSDESQSNNQLAQKRHLLTAAEPAERDPFRDPKTKSKKAQPVQVIQKPKELPGLKAIIYDHDDPVTQLLFRGTASKWLGVGGTFEEWEILTIAPDSVQVTDHEETITLFPNRRGNSPD